MHYAYRWEIMSQLIRICKKRLALSSDGVCQNQVCCATKYYYAANAIQCKLILLFLNNFFVSISGANSLPQYLRLPIVDTQSCADSYARFSANSRTPIIINDSQLCAQGTADRDTCQGDSGKTKR